MHSVVAAQGRPVTATIVDSHPALIPAHRLHPPAADGAKLIVQSHEIREPLTLSNGN